MNESTHSVHCAANGCCGAGVATRSTTGGSEWWCANHLMAEPGRIHEVTAEMRRLSWLVQLCKGIRHLLNTGAWVPEAEAAYKEIALHQRSDLYMLESTPTRPAETHAQWLRRLEAVLRDACAAPPPAAPHQSTIDD